MKTTLDELAKKYLLDRFPIYKDDFSVMHIDSDIYKAGFKKAIELACEICREHDIENGGCIEADIRSLVDDLPK